MKTKRNDDGSVIRSFGDDDSILQVIGNAYEDMYRLTGKEPNQLLLGAESYFKFVASVQDNRIANDKGSVHFYSHFMGMDIVLLPVRTYVGVSFAMRVASSVEARTLLDYVERTESAERKRA